MGFTQTGRKNQADLSNLLSGPGCWWGLSSSWLLYLYATTNKYIASISLVEEQTFGSRSPGWSNQSGLNFPAQRLEVQLLQEGTFSPGSWFKPGLKVTLQSRFELPAVTKPLIPVGGSNRDQNTIGSPGLYHKQGLHVPGYILFPSSFPNPSHFKLCVFSHLLCSCSSSAAISRLHSIPPSILRF